MDGYPLGSLDHSVPFIVASGLSSESNESNIDPSLRDGNIILRSGLPPLNTREARFLTEHFAEVDENGKSWTTLAREETYRLRIQSVGRVGYTVATVRSLASLTLK